MENYIYEQGEAMEIYMEEPTYAEKFDGCKRSWIKGAIFGGLMAAGISILFGSLFDNFFVSLLFWAPACIMTIASVFALNYTSGYGFSWLAGILMKISQGVWTPFEDTYVSAGFYYFLLAISLTAGVFGMVGFACLFPAETLYYWIRQKIEAKENA